MLLFFPRCLLLKDAKKAAFKSFVFSFANPALLSVPEQREFPVRHHAQSLGSQKGFNSFQDRFEHFAMNGNKNSHRTQQLEKLSRTHQNKSWTVILNNLSYWFSLSYKPTFLTGELGKASPDLTERPVIPSDTTSSGTSKAWVPRHTVISMGSAQHPQTCACFRAVTVHGIVIVNPPRE